MFSFFYNFILGLYLLFIAPIILFFNKKKPQILKRFFFSGFAFENKDRKPVIWIHAVSVGEAKAARPLLELIKKENPKCFIIFSSITTAGHVEAKKSNIADKYLYLPFDFSWIIRRVLKKTKPDIVIFIETDFWYHFLKFAKFYGAKTVLVSGKMSDKSTKRFSKIKFLSKKIFDLFDLILLQNNEYKNRFIQCGAFPNKVIVSGNLKFDEKITPLSEEEKKAWVKKFKIENNQIITIGSTHEPEEKLILDAFLKIWQIYPNLKVFLAPRHPERFFLIKKLLNESGIAFGSYSRLDKLHGNENIILLDVMGFLNTAYQLSDLALVGGSFIDRVGGHNILEPTLVNTPVFFGPSMQAQRDLKKVVLEYGAGKEVNLQNLNTEIINFFKDKNKQRNMRKNCLVLRENICGSVKKTWEEIKNFEK